MEQLDYNLLFCWFVWLSMDEPMWRPTPDSILDDGLPVIRVTEHETEALHSSNDGNRFLRFVRCQHNLRQRFKPWGRTSHSSAWIIITDTTGSSRFALPGAPLIESRTSARRRCGRNRQRA